MAVQELLEEHGFKELDYEEEQLPAAYLDRLEGEIKEQEAVVAATLAELQNSQKELDQLKYQMDYLLSLGAREEAKSLLASTQSLVALEGWIETAQVASFIISQYGGPDGELGASLRYLSQRYSMPYPELKGLLTDIGTEEASWPPIFARYFSSPSST